MCSSDLTQTHSGFSSIDVTNASGGNVVTVAIYSSTLTSPGNVVVLPGTTKVISPLNPPLAPTSMSIVTAAVSGTSTVYITPVVTQQG